GEAFVVRDQSCDSRPDPHRPVYAVSLSQPSANRLEEPSGSRVPPIGRPAIRALVLNRRQRRLPPCPPVAVRQTGCDTHRLRFAHLRGRRSGDAGHRRRRPQIAMAMAGEPLYIAAPQVMGVELTGEMPDWVSAKD